MILDPSDKFRPEKKEVEFRNYTSDNAYHSRVKNTYYQMHSNQCVQYVKDKVTYLCSTSKIRYLMCAVCQR